MHIYSHDPAHDLRGFLDSQTPFLAGGFRTHLLADATWMGNSPWWEMGIDMDFTWAYYGIM